jgi:TPR repeat protein
MSARKSVSFAFLLGSLVLMSWFSPAWPAAPPRDRGKHDKADRLYQEAIDKYLGLTGNIDAAKAVVLFRQAANLNHDAAGATLGWLTYKGIGTRRDEIAGERLLKARLAGVKKAAGQGDPFALFRLAKLYEDGLVVEKEVVTL